MRLQDAGVQREQLAVHLHFKTFLTASCLITVTAPVILHQGVKIMHGYMRSIRGSAHIKMLSSQTRVPCSDRLNQKNSRRLMAPIAGHHWAPTTSQLPSGLGPVQDHLEPSHGSEARLPPCDWEDSSLPKTISTSLHPWQRDPSTDTVMNWH